MMTKKRTEVRYAIVTEQGRGDTNAWLAVLDEIGTGYGGEVLPHNGFETQEEAIEFLTEHGHPAGRYFIVPQIRLHWTE